jgi:hypothetical protein
VVAAGIGRDQQIWIESSDGTKIRFPPYQNGAEELVETLFERASHLRAAK